MTRKLCSLLIALSLFAAANSPSDSQAQTLSIGRGGVQYTGYGRGYYGSYGGGYRGNPNYSNYYAPQTQVYSTYGYGPYGYGSRNRYHGAYNSHGYGDGNYLNGYGHSGYYSQPYVNGYRPYGYGVYIQ